MNNNFNSFYPQPNSFNPMTKQQQQVVKVLGEEGAKAYELAPNSSILLMDTSGSVIWLKATDEQGYPKLWGYDITPHQTQEEKLRLQNQNLENLIKQQTQQIEVLSSEISKLKQGSGNQPIESMSEKENEYAQFKQQQPKLSFKELGANAK